MNKNIRAAENLLSSAQTRAASGALKRPWRPLTNKLYHAREVAIGKELARLGAQDTKNLKVIDKTLAKGKYRPLRRTAAGSLTGLVLGWLLGDIANNLGRSIYNSS